MSKRTQSDEEKELRDSWCTPEWVWRAPLEALGIAEYDTDPCSNEWSTVPAKVKYTKADNGLDKPWGRYVWLNPPYSRPLLGQFMQQAFRRTVMDQTTEAVFALLPFAPGTAGWESSTPRYGIIIPRLSFTPPPGVGASPPGPVPHALCLYTMYDTDGEAPGIMHTMCNYIECKRPGRLNGTQHWIITP